jgi:methyl-accepting chemotaxis protein
VGVQVLIAIGLLMLMVFVTGGVGLALLFGLRGDERRLNDANVPYANAISSAALDAKGIANDERGYLMSGEPRFITEMEHRLQSARQAFSAATSSAVTSDQQQAVTEAQVGFETWVGAVHVELETYDRGDQRASINAALGPHRDLRKEYERELAHAQGLASGALKSDAAEINDASSRSVRIFLAFGLLACLVGAGVAMWVTRTILRPIFAILSLLGDIRIGAAEPI